MEEMDRFKYVLKAKAWPVGTRRKWKGGIYEKKADNKWYLVEDKHPKQASQLSLLDAEKFEDKGPKLSDDVVPETQTLPDLPKETVAEKKTEFKPSEQQQAFYNWIQTDKGHAVLNARAGTGKTTTIVNALKHIPSHKRVSFFAFNKKIQKELESRVPSHVKTQTFHSFGYGTWAKFINASPQLENNKSWKLMDAFVPEHDAKEYGKEIIDLVDKAKIIGLVPRLDPNGSPWTTNVSGIVPDDKANWVAMIQHFDIEIPPEAGVQDKLIEYARKILANGLMQHRLIDFADMLYMPLAYNCRFFQPDWIFIDEAQDTSDVRREIAKRAMHAGTRLVAVGDPRQAIFGFAGSNPESFDLIKEEMRAKEFPLSVSYRCGKNIIKHAQEIVPDIQAAPTNSEGEIIRLGRKWDHNMFRAKDLIMCRTNAPLISLAYQFLAKKIPCQIAGRDIGRGLASVLEKVKGKDLDDTADKLLTWRDKQVSAKLKRDPKANVQSIEDKFEALMTFIENADPHVTHYKQLKDVIMAMFVDEDGRKKDTILLSSVHQAKGLEADRAFILNSFLMPLKWAKKEWEQDQEQNIIYVARTRAIHQLVYFDTEDPQKGKDKVEKSIKDVDDLRPAFVVSVPEKETTVVVRRNYAPRI